VRSSQKPNSLNPVNSVSTSNSKVSRSVRSVPVPVPVPKDAPIPPTNHWTGVTNDETINDGVQLLLDPVITPNAFFEELESTVISVSDEVRKVTIVLICLIWIICTYYVITITSPRQH
jgi:hypothetical protein